MRAATLTELDDRGYAAASLRTIAVRANVPLETVFDRWHSKQHLVEDAINELARRQPAPETGDLRTDLLQVIEALSELLTRPGAADVLRRLPSPAVPDHGTFPPPGTSLLGERRAMIRRIVERGQRRQQCPEDVHPGVAADAIVGGLVYRLLIAGDPVTRRTVTALVDLVLADAS